MDCKHCNGCRNDFYNDKNPLGVKRCWSLDSARLVWRWTIGTWTPMDKKSNFRRVKVPHCYHREGACYMHRLPQHLGGAWADKKEQREAATASGHP